MRSGDWWITSILMLFCLGSSARASQYLFVDNEYYDSYYYEDEDDQERFKGSGDGEVDDAYNVFYSRSTDIVLIAPYTSSVDVTNLLEDSFASVLDEFLSEGEENLNRVRVALVSLNLTNRFDISARMVFDLTHLSTRAEALVAFNNSSLKSGRPLQLSDGRVMSLAENQPVDHPLGFRQKTERVLVVFMFDISDVLIKAVTMSTKGRRGEFLGLGVDQTCKLLIVTNKPNTTSLSPDLMAREIHISENNTWPLGVIHKIMCQQGCPSNQFSSKNGTSCYFLSSDYNTSLDDSAFVKSKCPSASKMASIETTKEYEFLEVTIKSILQSKQTPWNQSVNVFIHLRRDKTSVAGHFSWADQKPLTYDRWMNKTWEEPKDCVVWTFKPPINDFSSLPNPINETFGRYNGFRIVDCDVAVTGRQLCERKKGGKSEAMDIDMKMTPIRKTHESMEKVVPMGSFFYREKYTSVSVPRLYMSALEILCLVFHDCDSRKKRIPLETNEEEGLKVDFSVSVFPAGRTLQDLIDYDWRQMMFECDDLKLIPYSSVCDDAVDCTNLEDEKNCEIGYSIKALYALDLDRSDYAFPCRMAYGFGITIRGYLCKMNGKCLPREAECDMYQDCPKEKKDKRSDDEGDCGSPCFYVCGKDCTPQPYGRMKCVDFITSSIPINVTYGDRSCALHCNRTRCVSAAQMNDGVVDCKGPEGHIDETWGRLEGFWCKANDTDLDLKEINWSPRCVLIRDRFKSIIGCRSMEHLEGCEHFNCPEGYVKCPDAYCIPSHAMKDNRPDCPNGEDEEDHIRYDNNMQSFNGTFKCDHGRYLHPELLCDGLAQCKDNGDEMGCDVRCRKGFQCLGDAIVPYGWNHSEELTDLSFIHPDVRFLKLSDVKVPTFFKKVPRYHLQRLLYLMLANCSIDDINSLTVRLSQRAFPDEIRDRSFDFLAVRQMDLSRNLLTRITNNSPFPVMPQLQSLNLSHNIKLTDIAKYGLRSRYALLNDLGELDLSWCGLTSLDPDTFRYLYKLKRLYLQGTQLLHFSVHLPTTLQFLDLRIPTLESMSPLSSQSLEMIESVQTTSFRFCCPQILGPNFPQDKCHSPEEALSSCKDLMREPILRILLWLIGVTAVLANVFVIVYRLVIKDNNGQTAFEVFIVHLSVSDLLMGVYLLIIATMDNKFRDEYASHEREWRMGQGCNIAGFLSTISSEASASFVFLLTLDRFLVIKFPFSRYRFTKQATRLSCCIAWAVALVLAAIPLMCPSHSVQSIYHSDGMCQGIPLSALQRQHGWHYSVAVFIGFNSFLFVLIAIGQMFICRSVCRKKSEDELATATMQVNRREQEVAVTKRLLLVIASNILRWSLIAIMGLMILAGQEISSDVYRWYVVVVVPISSALNPLLYVVSYVPQVM